MEHKRKATYNRTIFGLLRLTGKAQFVNFDPWGGGKKHNLYDDYATTTHIGFCFFRLKLFPSSLTWSFSSLRPPGLGQPIVRWLLSLQRVLPYLVQLVLCTFVGILVQGTCNSLALVLCVVCRKLCVFTCAVWVGFQTLRVGFQNHLISPSPNKRPLNQEAWKWNSFHNHKKGLGMLKVLKVISSG